MNPEIWMVAPKERDRRDPDVCDMIRGECDRRSWPNPRLVRPSVVRNSAGKPLALLEPDLANNLYQRLHRVRLAILTTAEVLVRLNPTRHVLDEKWLATLSRLVRYKGYCARVSSQNLATVLDDLEAWSSASHCDDERDPRVLPLHSFCPETDCPELDLEAGRTQFNLRFGPPTVRVCEQQMVWRPDLSRHGGREPQNVAGLLLTRGLHWDVVGQRQSSTLLTLVDVWQVPRRRHVNVYPNGYVRGRQGVRRLDEYRSAPS
jgi:hypothetical protein